MKSKQEKKNNRKKSKKQTETRIRDLKAAEDPKGGESRRWCKGAILGKSGIGD
jgi:hypothetical protein